MLGVVIQTDARDPVTDTPVAIRAGTHDHADVCHLTGDVWWPTIAKLPKLGYDLFDGAFEGAITAPSASMSIAIEPWPDFARLAIADARFRLWTGEVGAPWGAWTQRVDARVTQQPKVADGRAELTFAVDDRWLDRALLATYAGTTGAEGPAALKGQAKPLALGAPRYVPGVLVDAANSLFQISGYGPIGGIDAAMERLVRFGAPIADYANVDALLAATIPAGRWATALSGGWARFGAPTAGQVSFLVRGDIGGRDVWARRPGQIIRRLALMSGGVGRIADAALDALDAARPYDLSLYLDQQTTARQLVQDIAASVNAVAGVSWMGRLFVHPVAIDAPTITLAADGSTLPPVGTVQQIEISPPFGKLAMTAERAWAVHALSEIAFTAPLVDMGDYGAAIIYREGNIVSAADSSRWIYTATVPSAGNGPRPGSAFWTAYAAAPTVPWDKVSDPAGTKPADNADVTGENTAKDTAAVGGKPVAEVLTAIDSAKARQDALETVTIPAIASAVDEADRRIIAARGRADEAYTQAITAGDDAARVQRHVEELSSSAGTGGNLLSNTDFALDAAGWVFGSEAGSDGARNGVTSSEWWPIGTNVLVIGQGNDSPARAGYWMTSVYGIEPGAPYQASVYSAAHRCQPGIYIDVLDSAGAYLGTYRAETGGSSGRSIEGYERIIVNFVAPAGAARLFFYLMKYGTAPGQQNSYAWYLRPQLVRRRPEITAAVPYSPGSGDAGRIASDARVTRELATLADTDRQLAQASTDLEARMGDRVAATARDLTRVFTEADLALGNRALLLEASAGAASTSNVFNDTFNFWPDGQNLPSRWVVWAAEGNFRTERLSPGRGGGLYCVRTLNDVAGVNSGFFQTIYTAGRGKWVIEVIVDKVNGSLNGAGVTLHGIWNVDFCADPDTNGVIGDSVDGEVRAWSKMVDLDGRDQINVHAMHGWTGFGRTIYPKAITWHCLRLRPATDGEIKAGKADAALFGAAGVLARIKSTEDTLADLPNRYAAASRTDQLEAQVNLGTDSGLKRVLSAQIEDRAAAIADGKVGVVVSDVSNLRGEYNNTKGEVSRQAGVIVDLQGKSSAYVKIVADAGNGRAALSLWSDQYGGAWSLTGDGLIDGNLTVNGTLKARAFDRGSMSREGRVSWNGPATPSAGQEINLPGLGLPSIPAQGRFFYEVTARVDSNAGQTQTTTINGQPAYLTFQDDGGFLIRAIDGQGNAYTPRVNASTQQAVVASSDFNPNFAVTVRRGNMDTGWIHDGDYYHREISATYTVVSYDLRVTWIAV